MSKRKKLNLISYLGKKFLLSFTLVAISGIVLVNLVLAFETWDPGLPAQYPPAEGNVALPIGSTTSTTTTVGLRNDCLHNQILVWSDSINGGSNEWVCGDMVGGGVITYAP
jgi:hypothetical protein